MPTRNVVLTERQETLIEVLVQSGRYQNASKVMGEGLRFMENREVEEATRLAALRAATDTGLSAQDRAEFKEFSAARIFAAHLDKIGDAAIAAAKLHAN